MAITSYLFYNIINIQIYRDRDYENFIRDVDSIHSNRNRMYEKSIVYYDSSMYYLDINRPDSYIYYMNLWMRQDSILDITTDINVAILRDRLNRTEDSLRKRQYGIFYTRKYK